MSLRRRSANIANCIDLAIHDITAIGDTPCDGSTAACMWMGSFEVSTFNDQEDGEHITYEWTVDVGAIQGSDTEASCEIWVSAQVDTVIHVTCKVTSTLHGTTSTLTKEFITKNTL